MNLSFNNLQELDEFLQWATHYGASQTLTLRVDDLLPKIDASLLDAAAARTEAGSDGAVAFDTPPTDTRMPPPVSGDPSGACLVPAAEPTKRKRRTKAEIEADEKAAAEGKETAEALLHKRNNDIAAGLVHEAQAAEAAKQPEGANPFAQAAEASTPPADAQGDGAGESEVVTPFQHLTRAREFIAKHGMPKYNETFAKAGLDANVMAYSAYQRAVHVAALDEMDKA